MFNGGFWAWSAMCMIIGVVVGAALRESHARRWVAEHTPPGELLPGEKPMTHEVKDILERLIEEPSTPLILRDVYHPEILNLAERAECAGYERGYSAGVEAGRRASAQDQTRALFHETLRKGGEAKL